MCDRETRNIMRVIRANQALIKIATKRGDSIAAAEYKRSLIMAENQKVAVQERHLRAAAAKAHAKGEHDKASQLMSRADALKAQIQVVPPPPQLTVNTNEHATPAYPTPVPASA